MPTACASLWKQKGLRFALQILPGSSSNIYILHTYLPIVSCTQPPITLPRILSPIPASTIQTNCSIPINVQPKASAGKISQESCLFTYSNHTGKLLIPLSNPSMVSCALQMSWAIHKSSSTLFLFQYISKPNHNSLTHKQQTTTHKQTKYQLSKLLLNV